MGSDLADDLEGAEELLADAASTIALLIEAVFGHRPTVLRIEPGQPLHEAIENGSRTVEAWRGYCRASCSYRDTGECESGDPDLCGCPCAHAPKEDAATESPSG